MEKASLYELIWFVLIYKNAGSDNSISIWSYFTRCLYLLSFEKLTVSYTKLYFEIVYVSYSFDTVQCDFKGRVA